MMAAGKAASFGHEVTLFEKNKLLGMKSTYLRKMKNLERSFSSREKADAISRIIAITTHL